MADYRRCPDMPEGAFFSVDPSLFDWNCRTSDRDLHALVLSLALIFNDLKGLQWWLTQLNEGKPPAEPLRPYVGNHGGMTWQVCRLQLGLLHELLALLKKNAPTLEHPKLQKLWHPKKHLRFRQAWEDLVAASQGRVPGWQADKDFMGYLQRVRSTGIYHYENVNGLLEGYRHFFSGDHIRAKRAYYSVGLNMEGTRFYFADAASQGVDFHCRESLPENMRDVFKIITIVEAYTRRVNESLWHVVKEYIRQNAPGGSIRQERY